MNNKQKLFLTKIAVEFPSGKGYHDVTAENTFGEGHPFRKNEGAFNNWKNTAWARTGQGPIPSAPTPGTAATPAPGGGAVAAGGAAAAGNTGTASTGRAGGAAGVATPSAASGASGGAGGGAGVPSAQQEWEAAGGSPDVPASFSPGQGPNPGAAPIPPGQSLNLQRPGAPAPGTVIDDPFAPGAKQPAPKGLEMQGNTIVAPEPAAGKSYGGLPGRPTFELPQQSWNKTQ